EFALYDIDNERLKDSEIILNNIKKNLNSSIRIEPYTDRKKTLRAAKYVINAIQVGGYEPSTVIACEIPKKAGLHETSGDTLVIGVLLRNVRTSLVMMNFAKDSEEVCADAWFLNYTSPMSVLTGSMLRYTGIKTVGLCHSVQVCTDDLLKSLD